MKYKYSAQNTFSSEMLKLDRNLKLLVPVFLTQDRYLTTYDIPDIQLYQKDNVTVVQTPPTLHPFVGCPYFSFDQLSPANTAENALSWVITPNPGQEVVQFLTSQINYRIKWKLKSICQPSGNERVTFLLPYEREGKAYEPWDINGDRIKFKIPTSKGCITKGEFVVPGTYNQFIIESSGYTLAMQMKIIGNRQQRIPDPWFPNVPGEAYCVVTSGCYKDSDEVCEVPQAIDFESERGCKGKRMLTCPAYRNVSDNVGIVAREVFPEFEWLNTLVNKELRRNARLSCFVERPPIGEEVNRGPFLIDMLSRYNLSNGTANPTNIILPYYRKNLPPLICDFPGCTLLDDVIVPDQNFVRSQSYGFTLAPLPARELYKVSFNVTVQSMSYNQLDTSIPGLNGTSFDGIIQSRCGTQYLALQMYNVGDSTPVEFDPLISNPFSSTIDTEINFILNDTVLQKPTTSASDDYLLSQTQMFVDGEDPTFWYYFGTPSTKKSSMYAVRISGTMWSYDVKRGTSTFQIQVGGAWLAEVTMRLEVVQFP